MDDNKTTDDELQKAINEITKNTSVEPVFSDPVAAPSTVPDEEEGPIEAVGPFMVPELEAKPAEAPVENMNGMPTQNVNEAPVLPGAPVVSETQTFGTTLEPAGEPFMPSEEGLNVQQVHDAALRDLLPLLKDMRINPSQKFAIYRSAFEKMHDHTLLDDAYNAARMISDVTERGEALYYIVRTIENM